MCTRSFILNFGLQTSASNEPWVSLGTCLGRLCIALVVGGVCTIIQFRILACEQMNEVPITSFTESFARAIYIDAFKNL